METKEDRLLELLYQHGIGMEREEYGPKQLSQSEVLEHSPFKVIHKTYFSLKKDLNKIFIYAEVFIHFNENNADSLIW